MAGKSGCRPSFDESVWQSKMAAENSELRPALANDSRLPPFLFEHPGCCTTSVRAGRHVENEERKPDLSAVNRECRPEIHDDGRKLGMSNILWKIRPEDANVVPRLRLTDGKPK
jgi:hypothetical protein